MKVNREALDLLMAREVMTQRKLVEQSKISSTTIAVIRKGGEVSPHIVGKLAEFFDVDVEYLVGKLEMVRCD